MAGDNSKLRQEHVAPVESLIRHNPGISLVRLTELVAWRLSMPKLAFPTLRSFMERNGLAILPPEPPSSPLPCAGMQLVDHPGDVRVHRTIARRSQASQDHRFGLRVDPSASLVDQARQRAADWLDTRTAVELASAAMLAARRKTWQQPDDPDFDPTDPQAWFDPLLFVDDVVDLFRLAVLRVAVRSGIPGANDQRAKWEQLGGAEWLKGVAGPIERGLGQRPSEPAEGSAADILATSPGLSAGAKT